MDPHRVYRKLFGEFGRQNRWIPAYAGTGLKVIVGVIFVRWMRLKNAEKAIESLKRENLLGANSLVSADSELIRSLIRPSGFYKQKAKRIMSLCRHLIKEHGGSIDSFSDRPARRSGGNS